MKAQNNASPFLKYAMNYGGDFSDDDIKNLESHVAELSLMTTRNLLAAVYNELIAWRIEHQDYLKDGEEVEIETAKDIRAIVEKSDASEKPGLLFAESFFIKEIHTI